MSVQTYLGFVTVKITLTAALTIGESIGNYSIGFNPHTGAINASGNNISFTDPGLLVTAVRAFAADPLKVSELLFNGETPTETVSGINASVEVLGRSQTFYMSKIQEKAYGTISDGGPAVVVEASTQLPVSLPNGQAVNATYSVSTEASFSFSGGFPSSGVPASATELLIFAAAGSAFAMGGQASQAKIQDLLKDFEVPRGVATI